MHKALKQRFVKRLREPEQTMDGAGVTLKRAVGTRSSPDIDPFLLFDHFGSSNPDEYIAGFPMHPHRGIETVTYMLEGKIRHRDSVGNLGVIDSGGVQWMTAGSGIMHEEMPEMTSGKLEGFQLWVNLPAARKMTAPAYQEIESSAIPVTEDDKGNTVKIIAGVFGGVEGPVRDISGAPTYLDVTIRQGKAFEISIDPETAVFGYLYRGGIANYEGKGIGERIVEAPKLVLFEEDGERLSLKAGTQAASLLVISGKPIGEPISRYGPFVMNTPEEIQTALNELRNGTFIKT